MIASVASGLGGRFFDELRDKRSLCYTVNAFASERRVAGSVRRLHRDVAASGGGRARRVARRVQAVARGARDRGRARARADATRSASHAIRQQSGGAVLADLVDAYLFGTLAELAEHDARVSAVTAESMQRVAETYFDPSRRVEGIIRGRG